jgi:hypothetical protein
MSPERSRAPQLLAVLLLALYPEPWRRRYAIEARALIEDDPPRLGALASLLRGALDAHLHPGSWQGGASATTRLRLSVGGAFCCWIALSAMGIGFQKETEEASFSASSRAHPLIALAHEAIVVGALIGAVAIALGGLPLLWQATRQALALGDRHLMLLLASPALAVLAFAALTALLVSVAPSRQGGFPVGYVISIMAPWQLGAAVCAATCALAPRFVLARMRPSPAALRGAARATWPLLLAMALVTCGLALYSVCLQLESPHLAGEASGPFGASIAVMLVLNTVIALLASLLAGIATGRARHAALRV